MDQNKLKQIAKSTARRAAIHKGKEEQWFFGYFAARDEGASHERSMELADRHIQKLSQLQEPVNE